MMKSHLVWGLAAAALVAMAQAQAVDQDQRVSENLTPIGQLLHPAGHTIELEGSRPIDVLLSRDRQRLYVKASRELFILAPDGSRILQHLRYPAGGSSMFGLVESSDGSRVYVTNSRSQLYELQIGDDGTASWGRAYALPTPAVGGDAFGCGVALTPDGSSAIVCCSRGNEIAVIQLESGQVQQRIDVGVAPFDVALSKDGSRAYVSNWGGRRPDGDDRTSTSAGTPAEVDERGVAASGTVSVIDLRQAKVIAEVEVGLSPSEIVLSPDETRLYIACSNEDFVTVLDTEYSTIVGRIETKPDPSLPFGSMPSTLALNADGSRLYVANAGNNAVAVIANPQNDPSVLGFIPTGWLPGALALDQDTLFIANIRGIGSRQARSDGAFNSHRQIGTCQTVPIPDDEKLAEMTRQCLADARVPQTLIAMERARTGIEPKPVPERTGEPSVFEHVVYVIKENRTYDQVFGDFAGGDNPKGEGSPELCIFGRDVTPNLHALADRYVLLDNYYCDGVLSADGHQWATQGNVTPYLERSFGGFARSYPFGGDDPLAFSSSGFIWDHVLAAGLSFRNYGEFFLTGLEPRGTVPQVLDDWNAGGKNFRFVQSCAIEKLRRYSNPDSPGWNLDIPDQIRADIFLKEFERFKAEGDFPSLVILYLPNDHTSGTGEGNPTPSAMVADNDLAVGRVVDAISHSRFWKTTCIFINEDDPQAGWDHIDGHRSICVVASPYTKRNAVISDFANQSGVVHTIERILGVPGMSQRYMLAPVLSFCFTDQPDFTPFDHLPANVSITEMNPAKTSLGPAQRHWLEVSERQNLDQPDAVDEDEFNRVLWHAVKGADARYPAEWAGAHGRGLKALGLRLDSSEVDDDD